MDLHATEPDRDRAMVRSPGQGQSPSYSPGPGQLTMIRQVLALQRSAGNGATRSLIQAGMTAGPASNRYEHKADRVASGGIRTLQRQPEEERDQGVQSAKGPDPSAPEDAWEGSIRGYLGVDHDLRHTLENFGDQELDYSLRVHSLGHAMVSLETQYEYKFGGLQRAWTVIYARRGETQEVTSGLPPHSSCHLRFFGERDPLQKDQSYFEGTVEVRRTK